MIFLKKFKILALTFLVILVIISIGLAMYQIFGLRVFEKSSAKNMQLTKIGNFDLTEKNIDNLTITKNNHLIYTKCAWSEVPGQTVLQSCWVVLDGKKQKEYGLVKNLVVNTKKNKIAYVAKDESTQKNIIVLQDIESGVLQEINVDLADDIYDLSFVPDTEKLSYKSKTYTIKNGTYKGGEVYYNFTDGKKYGPFGAVNTAWSPDGTRYFSYECPIGFKTPCDSLIRTFNGDILDKMQTDVFRVAFSDSGEVAAKIHDNKGKYTVDSKWGNSTSYDEIGVVTVGHANNLAYSARSSDKWRIVINGKESSDYFLVDKKVVFSANGENYAYSACEKIEKCFVVYNGNNQQTFKEVNDISFSEDNTLAYQALKSTIGFMYFYLGRYEIVVNGKTVDSQVASPLTNYFGHLSYSKDGKSVSYVLYNNGVLYRKTIGVVNN